MSCHFQTTQTQNPTRMVKFSQIEANVAKCYSFVAPL